MTYEKNSLAWEKDRGYFRIVSRRADGKPARFRLGKDPRLAEERCKRLMAFWTQQMASGAKFWTDANYEIGQQIGKGIGQLRLGDPDKENVLAGVLRDPEGTAAILCDPAIYQAVLAIMQKQMPMPVIASDVRKADDGTLHQAFTAFQEHLRSKPDESGHVQKCIQAVDAFREHHADMPLSDISEAVLHRMRDYWAARPNKKGTCNPIAIDTADGRLKRLATFFRWLHITDQFAWRCPAGYEQGRVKIAKFAEDRQKKTRALTIETFSVEELAALYQAACPVVRSMMLLSLNCGFKYAEIATLTRDELHIGKVHPFADRLHVPKVKMNWIGRLRGKTDVYGEWELWTETAIALVQAVEHANKIGERNLVFVSERGKPYTAKTSGGNRSGLLGRMWDNTCLKSGLPKDRQLSFKHLEKTAADAIRNSLGFGGEISGLFECHGDICKTDDLADIYANRPFGTLFKALAELRVKFAPIFAR